MIIYIQIKFWFIHALGIMYIRCRKLRASLFLPLPRWLLHLFFPFFLPSTSLPLLWLCGGWDSRPQEGSSPTHPIFFGRWLPEFDFSRLFPPQIPISNRDLWALQKQQWWWALTIDMISLTSSSHIHERIGVLQHCSFKFWQIFIFVVFFLLLFELFGFFYTGWF